MKATFKFSISQETMQRICWVLVLGAISFYFLFMLYGDNLINSVVGYRYLDSVLTGHLAEFYNAMDWSYGISIYTIYAVWSLPVWIFFRITGLEVNVETIPVLLWYKLLLVIFAVWSVYLIGKIARYVYEGKEKEMQLQYACSFLFVFPVFAIAQCDIIGLCFVLLGVYYYLQEKEAKFLLFLPLQRL